MSLELRSVFFAFLCVSVALGGAVAQEAPPLTETQPETFFDAYWKARTDLREAGLYLKFSDTNFYQGLASGTGNHSFRFGGKLEATGVLDLSRFGFWDGFSVTAKVDYNYGRSANGFGGTLLPINTALAFPGLGDEGFDVSSLYFTQKFGDAASVRVGKINTLDVASGTPLRGGGGIDTFMNLGLAAPHWAHSSVHLRRNWDTEDNPRDLHGDSL